MKLDVEELGATKRRLKVEIPVEDIETALDKAYKDLNKSVKVDGFRPGKAPRAILEKRYNEGVSADLVEKLVPHYYSLAVKEARIYPVASPSIDDQSLSVKKGQPLAFTATVEVRPNFELGDYKALEVTEEAVEVTDDETAKAIDEIRDMQSTLDTVEEDRPSVNGDHLIIDFEGFIEDKSINGAKAENYDLELGSNTLIPGFEEQLVGAKKGEDKEVKVAFPADYRNKELAGREAAFKVAVKDLKVKTLPVLDDAFAASVAPGLTVATLKEKVAADILATKKREMAARQKSQIVDALTERHSFEVPLSMVETETRALITRRYKEISQMGLTPAQAGLDISNMQAEFKATAEKRARAAIILMSIAEKENLDVTDEDLLATIKRMSAETGHSPQEIMEIYKKRDGSLEELRSVMAEEKVMEFLLSSAKKV